MIRFPNPGSDIDQMIKIFKILYANLSNTKYFTLDNMAQVMTLENVASSSGYIGSQALLKSYERTDKSRNPIYNQAKMYAEIYRTLGWIVSSGKALEFNFTFLGYQVAHTEGYKDIFEQCLLGITYPNEVLGVVFEESNKPFVSILLYAEALGGKICRDEIILTSLNTVDFFDCNEFTEKVQYIKELRNSKEKNVLKTEKEKIQKIIDIKPTTMENYTRFVISSLVYVGWFEKVYIKEYGRKNVFLSVTEKGRNVIKQIHSLTIVNTFDLDKKDLEEQRRVGNISLLQMFDRANHSVDAELEIFGDESLDYLFSPFQYYNKEKQIEIFPQYQLQNEGNTIDFEVESADQLNKYSSLSNMNEIEVSEQKLTIRNSTLELLNSIYQNTGSIDVAISELDIKISQMKQYEFYPLIAELFQIVFNSRARAPQAGVNNERFDIIIPDSILSVPVEVKSPTEEIKLSVKAIRQALENKIVLMSRYSSNYPTKPELASLALGYQIPEQRSDVYMLIEDIYSSYKINIAILSVEELLKATYNVIINGKVYSLESLKNYRGVISFEDF